MKKNIINIIMKTGITGIIIAYIFIICKLINLLICVAFRKSTCEMFEQLKEIYVNITKNPIQELVKDLESDYDDLDDEII